MTNPNVSPCFKCTERKKGCHATCDDYKSWYRRMTGIKARERYPYTVGENERDSAKLRGIVRRRACDKAHETKN